MLKACPPVQQTTEVGLGGSDWNVRVLGPSMSLLFDGDENVAGGT